MRSVILFIIKITLIVAVLAIIFNILTRKYKNNFPLTLIFAKKGSGKTTLIAKLAYQYHKRGYECYCNVSVKHCHQFDPALFGKFKFPPGSVIFVDEVNLLWDNRDFKTMPKDVIAYLRLQRHYQNRVYIFSQSFDCDKKIRTLTDEMYLLDKRLRVFSYARKIRKIMTIRQAEFAQDADSQVVENLEFEPFVLFFLGTRMLTFIPKWIRNFNSFEVPQLPDMPYTEPRPEAKLLAERDSFDENKTHQPLYNRLRNTLRNAKNWCGRSIHAISHTLIDNALRRVNHPQEPHPKNIRDLFDKP